MTQVLADTYRQRIAVLERVVATERELLAHPTYTIRAARLIAKAKHELAILRMRSISPARSH